MAALPPVSAIEMLIFGAILSAVSASFRILQLARTGYSTQRILSITYCQSDAMIRQLRTCSKFENPRTYATLGIGIRISMSFGTLPLLSNLSIHVT